MKGISKYNQVEFPRTNIASTNLYGIWYSTGYRFMQSSIEEGIFGTFTYKILKFEFSF